MTDQERLSEQAREIAESIAKAVLSEAERLEHPPSMMLSATSATELASAYLSLARQLTEAERALAGITPESPWDIDQDCRYCAGHYDWHEDDCAWRIAREVLDTGEAQASPPKCSSGEALDTGGSEG